MNAQQLKQIVPAITAANLAIYPQLLQEILPAGNIITIPRICAFVAQVAHESCSFYYTKEIASGKAYEGRADLGNIHPGDGVKFKGRGLIQVTGRINYNACSLALFGDDRLLHKPQLLEQPRHAVQSACWFWKSHKLNSICDLPDTWLITKRKKDGTPVTYTKFQWLTININGGLNGYIERLAFFKRALQVII